MSVASTSRAASIAVTAVVPSSDEIGSDSVSPTVSPLASAGIVMGTVSGAASGLTGASSDERSNDNRRSGALVTASREISSRP